mgnify:FL=1
MASKKIIVKIAAGLGNQMFMYANAYALSHKYSLNLLIDNTSGFFQKKNRTLSREYGLNIFNLSTKECLNCDKFDNYLKHFIKKILVLIDRFKKNKMHYKEKIFRNKVTKFSSINLDSYSKKIYIEGYYQSEKYFMQFKKEIANEFTINSSNLNDPYKNMLLDSNSVSLHLRRNRFKNNDDNLGDPNYTGPISFESVMNYTYRGIDFFRQNIKNPHFFIWSDNFKDIEKYFKGTNFTYIQGKDIKHDFYLFQFAKHFIVSPSTFHWWGAWLNSSVNKTCLRPKDINPSSNVDFWPDKWIAI